MARPGLTNDADVRSLASNALLRLFDSLYEGQAVQYNEGMGPKGKRAENVRVG